MWGLYEFELQFNFRATDRLQIADWLFLLVMIADLQIDNCQSLLRRVCQEKIGCRQMLMVSLLVTERMTKSKYSQSATGNLRSALDDCFSLLLLIADLQLTIVNLSRWLLGTTRSYRSLLLIFN